MIEELAGELADPSGRSLRDAWRASTPPTSTLPTGARSAEALVVTRIGSGSDHTVFINHLGVPVVDMSFNGPYGVYHSAYDSHHWVSRIGDPGFRYAHLMTQLWGTMALRLANAALLPLDVEAYAAGAGRLRRPARRDPRSRRPARHRGRSPRRCAALAAAGRALNARAEAALAAGRLDAGAADRVNRALLQFERTWLHDAGIPGRPWFKHLLFAPRYTYAAMTLPGDHRGGGGRRLAAGRGAAGTGHREGARQHRGDRTGRRRAAGRALTRRDRLPWRGSDQAAGPAPSSASVRLKFVTARRTARDWTSKRDVCPRRAAISRRRAAA